MIVAIDLGAPALPLVITVPGPVVGKQRPRFGQGRTFTPTRTLNAEAWVKACAVEQVGQPCLDGALSLAVAVTCPIPTSWPRKRQEAALAGSVRPTGKPDADNVLKLLADALNGIVWRDDAQLVEVALSKRYGAEPGAVLTVKGVCPRCEASGKDVEAGLGAAGRVGPGQGVEAAQRVTVEAKMACQTQGCDPAAVSGHLAGGAE